MKTKGWKVCSKCLRKFKNTVTYKGDFYCRVCYTSITGRIPHVPSKRLKCMSCGRERIVPFNVVMSICESCQVTMKEVE